jgi:hypothetical protein
MMKDPALNEATDLLRLLDPGRRMFDAYPFAALAVVYLVAVLAVMAFKPEAIRRPWAFRLSLTCFALFLILPWVSDLESIIAGFTYGSGGMSWAKMNTTREEARPFIDFGAEGLLIVAILAGLRALADRPKKSAAGGAASGRLGEPEQ